MNKINEIKNSLNQIERKLKTKTSQNLSREFWKTVGKIKRMPDPPDDLVERASSIRNTLFEKRFKVVISLKKGVALYALGFLICWVVFAYFLSIGAPSNAICVAGFITLNFFILYLGYPFGRLFGGMLTDIKFEGFYRYSPGELGLKIEYKSYLKAGAKRELMFACAALWIFVLVAVLIVTTHLFAAHLTMIPLSILTALTVLYSVATKRRIGEIYRFIRERKINTEMRKR